MNLNDNMYNFSFQFVDYEFNTFTEKSDIYDLNWLICRYEFIYKNKHISIDEASLTNFEVFNFIYDIKRMLTNNEYGQIRMQNLEPVLVVKFFSQYSEYYFCVHYNFYLDESFESIDFSVSMSKDELIIFLEELKKEISKFPYRRVIKYFNVDSKYQSIEDIAGVIKGDELVKGNIIYNSTDIVIDNGEFFKVKISDIYGKINNKYLYSITLNNKHYCCIEEDELINELHKLFNNNSFIVEYISEIGFFKRRWFDRINKQKNKLEKFNKKIVRVFNADMLLYYNEKYISLYRDLIEKYKLSELQNNVVKIFFSKDNKTRIQIYKNNISAFSFNFEKIEFREERDYGTTYNYALWIIIEGGGNYGTIEDVEKDIAYIIEGNGMSIY